MKTSKRAGANAVIAIVAVAVLIVLGASHSNATAPETATTTIEVPSARQLYVLNDQIWSLDTGTGAVYRFRGDVTNPSVRNTWELRVKPVTESTSGLLEIQTTDAPALGFPRVPHKAGAQSPGAPTSIAAIFLVDKIYGTTWILRDRGNMNGSWDLVPVFNN